MKIKEGYKVTELGELPVDWEIMPLSYGTESLKSGLSRKLSNQDIGIPCLRTNCIRNNFSISMEDLKYWYIDDPQGANTVEYFLKPNDILVGFINSIAQIGKCCIFNGYHRPTIYTTNIFRLRTNNKLIPYFFILFAQTRTYRNQIEQITKPAVNQASFTSGDFKNVLLPIPPLPEQQKIAKIISTVDEHITETESLIEKTKTLKQGMMQRLLTQGIGHTEFIDTEIGRIPATWEAVRFFNCFKKVIDFRGRTPLKLGLHWGGSIPALSAVNVKMGAIDLTNSTNYGDDELYNKWMSGNELKRDDVLMTMEAPLGNIALIPDNNRYILSQRVIALRPTESNSSHFVKYIMMSSYFQGIINSFSTGTTAKGINQKNLTKLFLPIPPLSEQRLIASILTTIDDHIDIYQAKLSALTRLKTGLMQQLLIGKIRVKV